MKIDLSYKVLSANEGIASRLRERFGRAGTFAVGGGPECLNCGTEMKFACERQEAKPLGSLG